MTAVPASLTQKASLVGLDLSKAGAPRSLQREQDAETEQFIMGRLAGLASLADRGGVDLIALDETFRLGGHRRRDAWLDGALAASRLARHTTRATLSATVPLGVTSAEHLAGAIASVHRASAQRGGWQLETGATSQGTGARAVDAVLAAPVATARRRTVGAASKAVRPAVVVPVRTPVDAELAAARADVARISVATLEEARAARTTIRAAAQEWGRDPQDVRVLVDVHTVISTDRASAQARWDLLASLELPPGLPALRTIGTAEDLAILWNAWVQAGAADGFTVVPASVPTDVLALVGEALPALASFGLRDEQPEPQREPAVPTRARRSVSRARVTSA